MVVHSILPPAMSTAAAEVLNAAGIGHVAHGDRAPVDAAGQAAADPHAVALLGPLRSADVAEAVEATAPAGLALLAPLATWAGLTRDDEPGCDDPAAHRGTVLRLVARDTVVAQRVAADIRAAGRRALVVAGEHGYGRQLDGQLRLAGLPRTDQEAEADVVVLAGLKGEAEVAVAAALVPLPVVAFDGIQGADLGAGREVRLALPFAPAPDGDHQALFAGAPAARRAAEMVAQAAADGAGDRATFLVALRRRGGFDGHGDPPDPPVWLWRVGPDGTPAPDRALDPVLGNR